MQNSPETPGEQTPEANLLAEISALGETRARNLLAALRKMNSSKQPGELFTVSDASTEWNRTKSGPSNVEDTLNGWVTTGKMYGSKVEGISEMRVSRAIELLAQKYESKEQR